MQRFIYSRANKTMETAIHKWANLKIQTPEKNLILELYNCLPNLEYFRIMGLTLLEVVDAEQDIYEIGKLISNKIEKD